MLIPGEGIQIPPICVPHHQIASHLMDYSRQDKSHHLPGLLIYLSGRCEAEGEGGGDGGGSHRWSGVGVRVRGVGGHMGYDYTTLSTARLQNDKGRLCGEALASLGEMLGQHSERLKCLQYLI